MGHTFSNSNQSRFLRANDGISPRSDQLPEIHSAKFGDRSLKMSDPPFAELFMPYKYSNHSGTFSPRWYEIMEAREDKLISSQSGR